MLLSYLACVILLASEPSCPAGQAWDGEMSMCMSVGAGNALAYDAMTSPDGCGPDSYFQFGMAMCLPRPTVAGRATAMIMGNVFAIGSIGGGPRFAPALAAPDWIMLNAGVDVASWNRFDLDVMLTAERWLYPAVGYRELLQIGEHNAAGLPYVDAQHPHSSPAMGLAITDVIAFSQDRLRLLRLSFAPRGETTDGPIAFMHRPSGTVNPDAPLGHHVGQDVGHVTSTVVSASLLWDDTVLEVSGFHGQEPQPTRVDLPIGKIDSVGGRVGRHWASWLSAAASVAYVADPEADHSLPSLMRYSASAYLRGSPMPGWRSHLTLIWGGISSYDHANFLNSAALEAVHHNDRESLWGRVEAVQRTAEELAVSSATGSYFVGAVTFGYTRTLASLGPLDLSLGAMATANFVPDAFAPSYGGNAAYVGRLFVEGRFMKMLGYGSRNN